LLLNYRGVNHVVTPERTPFAIGRSETCQLVVECGTASRAHAVIEVVGGDFVLTDQSKNGTFIDSRGQNSQALARSSCPLTGQGVIALGLTIDDPGLTEHALIHFQCHSVESA
jgi:pSer/pThr/pTyr-binding forkhead associated (FHA) protein